MPHATPTSPTTSPAKDGSSQKEWLTPTHVEDVNMSEPSFATGPMPVIPRRTSSHQSHSGSSTPRRVLSPSITRQASGSHQAPPFRPMEGIPRRASGSVVPSVSGLPTGGESSLGLKLHPSPSAKAPSMQRGIRDSMSSTSTLESSLPSTPSDELGELPLIGQDEVQKENGTVPFPAFEPPPRIPPPPRISSVSPPRPSLLASRRNSGLGHHRSTPHTGSLQINFQTSASTSSLHRQHVQSQPIRPTASMIRKKSGEVVKPSLKVRSMSTPDLTRQDDTSEPVTPEHEHDRGFPDERSKSVRFAGEDETSGTGALESVVLFLREQKPAAVGKAADPERSGQAAETETETENDASDFVQFRTRRNAAARAADEAEKIVLEGGSRVPRTRVDFAPDARGYLAGEHVVLERVELASTTGPLFMRGTTIVRNVSFKKWVAVRFTMDHWQTVSEVCATHVCNIPASTTGDEGWDRFGFAIKLEDFKRKLEERQLIMCVRFSVDGKEWWDSNDGINYNFSFKKTSPKRPSRASGPAALAGGLMRFNDPSPRLPGMRMRSPSPGSSVSQALGVTDGPRASGAKSWLYPRTAADQSSDTSRSAAPIPAPPPAAYRVPAPPDVHTHLSLSKWCAPSPPQSPPNESSFALSGLNRMVMKSPLPVSSSNHSPERLMNVMGGQLATFSPPMPDSEQDRRSSWEGTRTGSWDSFSQAMEQVNEALIDPTTPRASDGESTPVAAGSRSPAKLKSSSSSSETSSPEGIRLVSLKRSTGDLQALRDASDRGSGLLTPPSSTLSSPPSPRLPNLPRVPMSPSSLSTGESSPVNTVSSDSELDMSNLSINIDPQERGRAGAADYKTLSTSHQEFLDKFCFFQSPRMTPNEEPAYHRPSFVSTSGSVSPSGFPFFTPSSSNSPRGTPTPTKQYDSTVDAFSSATPIPITSPSPLTEIHGANGANGLSNVTPRASPPLRAPGLGVHDARMWAAHLHGPSPSLAAE